jgi:capsular polysaccharide biosynthesis protein
MCDVLPRIYLARSYVEGSTLVLPSSHDVPFVERSVAPFGLAGIAFFEPRTIASVRDAVIPGHIATTGNYHEPTMRALATLLRRHVLGGDASAPRRLVYVSRRRSAFRYVLNEDAVIEVVTRYGFEIVENEGLSFEEQVALYSETRFLIGIIGANLTNVMFMQPGGALLELAREGDAHNHLYWALAAAVGVRFGYQHCAYEDTREGDYWNLTVDPDLLARNIERMLEAA